MNTQSHRLIFNAARGCIMAVAETSSSDGKSCASGTTRSTRRQRTSSFRCAGLYASNQPLAPIEYAQEAPYFIANRSHWPGDIINSGTILGRDLVTLDAKNINNIGNNLTARAANVQAGAALSVAAGNNINIEAGVATQSDASGRTTEGSSFFASSKSTDRQSVSQTAAVGSSFGGNSVTLISKNDTRVQGSTVLADIDLTATAGGNVTITAATNTSTSSRFSGKTESGLSGSGYSVSLGSSEQSTDQKASSTTAAASTVGSVGGKVTITSGKTYTQTGSDVLATGTAAGTGNIDITAQKVDIVEARETSSSQTKTESKQSGFTLSVGGGVLQAAQTVQNMEQATQNTSNERMKALAAASAALAVTQAIANPMPTASVSFGSSESQSTSSAQSDTARGSSINASGNTTIRATGDGQNSKLTIQGSTVQSGGTTSLSADNDVRLLAAANTASQTSSQSSSSSSVGMSVGKDTGVTLSASQGSGDGNGQDLSYTNTQVQGKAVTIQSGADTTLSGAVVTADTVTANIGVNPSGSGGKLLLESLQDQSDYTEQSKNAGGSATIGPAPGASISLGQSNIDSSYASVVQQSGIRAGDGGFNVNVQGSTELKGGAITSTQKAIDDNKNTFQSASLSTSDIQNSAQFKADSAQINAGVGSSLGGSAGIGNKEGSAASTTQAAISGVAGNKEARTGDAETGIAKIFDADAVRKEINAQVAITQEFGSQSSAAWGNFANKKFEQALKSGDEDNMKCWGPDGSCRAGGHMVLGGLTGGASGAVAAGSSSVAAPHVQAFLIDQGVLPAAARAITQLAAMSGGAAIGGANGASAATNEAGNNAVVAIPLIVEGVIAGGAIAARACLSSPACLNTLRLGGTALVAKVAALLTPNELAQIPGFGSSTPLPPMGPTITPADAKRVYGTPPLNDPEKLRTWLGQVLQGYPADEAEKWVKDLIRTLPAADQQHYSDLIVQQVHHICTDKNCISPNTGGPWTPRFEDLFDKAGVSMQGDLNKVWVAGHQGPHPQEYHREVFDRLVEVTQGKSGDAYTQAFQRELAKIGKEIQTPGTKLNNLVTKK